jgi:Flp pilus assembly pilin Flp
VNHNFRLQYFAHSTVSLRDVFKGPGRGYFVIRHEVDMKRALRRVLADEGQDVAEYAVMLAVILAVVVGTIRLIGSNANNVFSSVGSAIQ